MIRSKKPIFLEAEWRKLIMANYEVDPNLLLPHLPYKTALDTFHGKCYVSLVGFLFLNTKIKGIPIPFHSKFEEVNLRFYVTYPYENTMRRGAVFLSEIVPKRAITLVANTLFGESYIQRKMSHTWVENSEYQEVSYSFFQGNLWHTMSILSQKESIEIAVGSEEEFIAEHYWGYSRRSKDFTTEYGVEHPRWRIYPTLKSTIAIDTALVYGKEWGFLSTSVPSSVFLIEGSEVIVRDGIRI
jgi:uncharacterized protein